MKELSLEEAALAWARGKMVEAMPIKDGSWKAVDALGECDMNKLSQGVFGFRDSYRFRLAPEPPAKKFRPYTREELIPKLGAKVVKKCGTYVALINIVLEECVGIGVSHFTFSDILELFTWEDGSPCGVEVDA